MIFLPLLLLAGEYVQDCRHAVVRRESFAGQTAVYTETSFIDSACVWPALSLRSYGDVWLGADLARPAGTREIDFTFRGVTLTVHSEEIAAVYRARALCEITDWRVDEERDITGRNCDFFGNGRGIQAPRAGDARYGVVRVTADALWFGALTQERDALSPGRRPSELDNDPFRLRVF